MQSLNINLRILSEFNNTNFIIALNFMHFTDNINTCDSIDKFALVRHQSINSINRYIELEIYYNIFYIAPNSLDYKIYDSVISEMGKIYLSHIYHTLIIIKMK